MKGSTHQEDIMTPNMCAPNKRASKYTKQMLKEQKGERQSTIIAEDLNTPLSAIYRTMRQNISTGKEEMNNKISQQYLTEIYRTLAEYAFFSNALECSLI